MWLLYVWLLVLNPTFKPIKYKNMYLIDGGLFDNVPIKPLEDKGYDIYAIDLFPKRKSNKKKKTSLLTSFKRNFFKTLYKNHSYSISNANFYLGSTHIRSFSLFTFKELDDCFNLGFKEVQNHF